MRKKQERDERARMSKVQKLRKMENNEKKRGILMIATEIKQREELEEKKGKRKNMNVDKKKKT